jgi:hypothetical protein
VMSHHRRLRIKQADDVQVDTNTRTLTANLFVCLTAFLHKQSQPFRAFAYALFIFTYVRVT